MCGIAGILLNGREGGDDEDRRVRAALARLRHRGPDDEGMCRSMGVVLGHRRLSILDLSPAGHQPMHTGDGRYVCTLNGEIYNYLELRAELADKGHAFRTGTDTEVLLAAFAEWDTAAVARCRELIDARQYVLDSDWGEVQPRADDQNAFLDKHSWAEYAAWHLGLTEGATDETKARYAFVLGDFRRIHRTALIACVYRAAEWRHKDVELAAHDLLQHLDRASG